MESLNLRVGIVGVAGKMGQTLALALRDQPGLQLTAATEFEAHARLGEDVATVCGASDPFDVALQSDIAAAAAACDVLIDFTRPACTLATLEAAVAANSAVVVGTTGFTSSELAQLEQAAERIPVMFSANYSVGVNVLLNLLERAASALGEDYDIEVVEAHHRYKVDAPSGTALAMGQALARGRGIDLSESVYARHGDTGAREKGVIGFQTVRGGDVVGEHVAYFLGDGQRVELGHKASSRANFAHGALRAARWLNGRPAGLYSMRDVLHDALNA